MKWFDYVVIFTSTDYHCIYIGSAKVAARTQAEAVRKAMKKLDIAKHRTWINIEEVYKFPRN
jgi:hypothetical protein